MKHLSFVFIFLFIGLFSSAQSFETQVENVINTVNLDSLIYQMRNLSGEDEVIIRGEAVYIDQRVSNWGNNVAADYLQETMESIGLETTKDVYSMTGINVISVQPGTIYPDEYYMICAHYDAVDYYCADDNASGCAAVIEAARIFSQMEFEYSIIYAFWDEEEIGLIGSAAYAAEAASNGDIIHSVVNMDMISWDSDEDMVVELHSSYNASSSVLADYMVEINGLYDLNTVPTIELPGTSASDHSSFWNNGYPSVLVIEEYYGGDFNPHYHTELDRIEILNMEYFHETSKLSIGTLASLCAPILNTSIDDLEDSKEIRLKVFPNPASDYAQLNLELSEAQNARISILNTVGQEILVVKDEFMSEENSIIQLPIESLKTGIYIVQIEVEHGVSTQKLMVN